MQVTQLPRSCQKCVPAISSREHEAGYVSHPFERDEELSAPQSGVLRVSIVSLTHSIVASLASVLHTTGSVNVPRDGRELTA